MENEDVSMLVPLVNPSADDERRYRVFEKPERRLFRTKTEYQVYVAGGIGGVRQSVAKLTEVPDNKELTLVAVGGNGTLNEVLGGARLSERFHFDFVPVGRDSGSTCGLRFLVTSLDCLKRILASRGKRSLDYGAVEFGGNEPLHHRFPVSCGVGFDAEWLSGFYALEQRRGWRSRPLWLGMRRKEGLHTLLHARRTRDYFETDSGQRVEFGYPFLLSVQLQLAEAGGIRLVNQVPLPGDQSTVLVLSTQSRLQQARLLLLLRCLQPEAYASVRVYRCREFRLCLDEALSFCTDDEGRGSRQEFTVRYVHRQIRLLC